MTQKHVDTLIAELLSDDAPTVSSGLREIQRKPTGNSRVLEAIRGLFSDRRVIITHIKPSIYYGELAWVAGLTLTYEYAKLGIEDNVEILDSFDPLTAEELNEIASDDDFKEAGSTENLIPVLDNRGKLNRQNIVFWTEHAWYDLKCWGEI